MRSILLRATRSFYATQAPPQKKNIFKLPLAHNFTTQALYSMQSTIMTAPSCKVLAVTFKDNINLITDTHLCRIYEHLRKYNLTIDNSFHQIIAPISLQYLKVFNRQQAIVMYHMIMAMLQLKIDNNSLWTALINKLDNQNCYRYIPLYQTSLLLNKLLENQQYIKLSLTKKLITVIYQQKLFYSNQQLCQPIINSILGRLENLKSEEPLLTEAYKQLK